MSLKTYHLHAERSQKPFEKSPVDYIELFNTKGFYFTKKEDRLHIHSIYSKYPSSIPLTQKNQNYLESYDHLDKILDNQASFLKDIENHGRDNLKSLWSSHLLERGQYKKAAYLFIFDGVKTNLSCEVLEHHMGMGFKEALSSVSRERIDYKQARLLRNGIYAIGNLISRRNPKREVQN